jgi:hypothetical protein
MEEGEIIIILQVIHSLKGFIVLILPGGGGDNNNTSINPQSQGKYCHYLTWWRHRG